MTTWGSADRSVLGNALRQTPSTLVKKPQNVKTTAIVINTTAVIPTHEILSGPPWFTFELRSLSASESATGIPGLGFYGNTPLLQQGCGMGYGRVGHATQHTGDFPHPFITLNSFEKGSRTTLLHGFRNDEMRPATCRDLWQMRDAKNLVRLAELPHFKGDLCGDFSPDIGINLVKNKEGDPVLIGKG
jgi:hypothetical protein